MLSAALAKVTHIRKTATTVKRNEVYTIVGEENGWGKLKSGAGWISLSSKYVTKIK